MNFSKLVGCLSLCCQFGIGCCTQEPIDVGSGQAVSRWSEISPIRPEALENDRYGIIILVPMYNSLAFMEDLVNSVEGAAEKVQPHAATHVCFRLDNDSATNASEENELKRLLPPSKSLHFSWSIAHNERNMGSSETRIRLLEDVDTILKDRSEFSAAADIGHLHLLYIDNDDILRPQLLICMLNAMVCSGADVLNGEYTIQKFNESTKVSLISESCPCDPSSYSYATLLVGSASLSPKWLQNGRMFCDSIHLGYQDYPPIMLKYNSNVIDFMLRKSPRDEIIRPGATDMQDLMMHYSTKSRQGIRAALIPNSDAPSLYLYRQHPGSIVHRNPVRFMEEKPVEAYAALQKMFAEQEEGEAGSEEWTLFLQILVDCDRDVLLAFLSLPWEDAALTQYREVSKAMLQHLGQPTDHLPD